jgi:hypothetical protein
MSCSVACRNTYNSGIRVFLVENHPEKGCLPMAVSSHKPDTFPGIDRETDVVKNNLLSI